MSKAIDLHVIAHLARAETLEANVRYSSRDHRQASQSGLGETPEHFCDAAVGHFTDNFGLRSR